MKSLLDYLGGQVVARLLILALTPLLTRSLSLEDFGLLGYFNAITSVFLILVSLNLPYALSREYYEDPSVRYSATCFSSYLENQLAWLLLLLLLFCVAVVSGKFSLVEMLAFVVAVLKLFGTVFYHIFQPRGMSRKILRRQILESAMIFLFSLAFLFLMVEDAGWKHIVVAQMLAFFFVAIYCIIEIRGVYSSWCNQGAKVRRKMLLYAISLIGFNTVCAIFYQFDRLWIGYVEEGGSLLAMHSLSFTIGWIYKIISISLIGAYSPKVMALLKDGNACEIKRLGASLLLGYGAGGLAFILFAPELVAFFGGEKYAGAVVVVRLFIVLFFFDFILQLIMICLNFRRVNRYASLVVFFLLLFVVAGLYLVEGLSALELVVCALGVAVVVLAVAVGYWFSSSLISASVAVVFLAFVFVFLSSYPLLGFLLLVLSFVFSRSWKPLLAQ